MSYFHLDDNEHFPCYVNKVYKCKDAIIFASDIEEAKCISSCEDVIELTGEEAKIAQNEFISKALKRHEKALNELDELWKKK